VLAVVKGISSFWQLSWTCTNFYIDTKLYLFYLFYQDQVMFLYLCQPVQENLFATSYLLW
jgi:hypothetical protein